MPGCWDDKIDRGPSIDDDIVRHRRKRGPKSFVIERRYIGPDVDVSLEFVYRREWHCFRAYETESALRNAMSALERSGKQWLTLFEVRTNIR